MTDAKAYYVAIKAADAAYAIFHASFLAAEAALCRNYCAAYAAREDAYANANATYPNRPAGATGQRDLQSGYEVDNIERVGEQSELQSGWAAESIRKMA